MFSLMRSVDGVLGRWLGVDGQQRPAASQLAPWARGVTVQDPRCPTRSCLTYHQWTVVCVWCECVRFSLEKRQTLSRSPEKRIKEKQRGLPARVCVELDRRVRQTFHRGE